MLKNKKGFTVVEIGVSFCLIFVICILLFQVILKLKEVYISSDIKTSLLNKQGIMLEKIYKEFDKKGLSNVSTCGVNCITFNFNDGTSSNYSVDPITNSITYDGYTWWLDKASSIDYANVPLGHKPINITKNINNLGYFQIQTTIKNSVINDDKDYGINIVYNLNEDNINIVSSDDTYYVAGIPCDYNPNYLTIFKHTKVNDIVTPFNNEKEVEYSNEDGKTSVLGSLESFRKSNGKFDFKISYYSDENTILTSDENTQTLNFMINKNSTEEANIKWIDNDKSFITSTPTAPTNSGPIASKEDKIRMPTNSDLYKITLQVDISEFVSKVSGFFIKNN